MRNPDMVPTLETERLFLRGHRSEDFCDSAAMWADPTVVAHISGTPLTREQSWSRLLRYSGHWSHLGFGYWVAETKSDGQFIGEVGFADFKREVSPSIDGMPEAGWVLKTSAHGQGFATEAVRRIVEWADLFLKARKTVCLIDPAHRASIAVARKVGYGNEVIGLYNAQQTLILERSRP